MVCSASTGAFSGAGHHWCFFCIEFTARWAWAQAWDNPVGSEQFDGEMRWTEQVEMMEGEGNEVVLMRALQRFDGGSMSTGFRYLCA